MTAGGEVTYPAILGFTHYWGKSRKGKWVVKRKTQGKRLAKAVKTVAMWCRRYRHESIYVQWKALNRKLLGHYAYYGITPDSKSLNVFYERVKGIWFKWLNRRSRTAHLNWNIFNRLLSRYPLERPRIVHSFL
jgi:hypothetical protein